MAKKGTCGACFRAMTLTSAGKVMRHGWSEVGGTRRVGEYGNVAHSGACFGVGWDPYEVSPECTKAFLAEVLFPMGIGIQRALAYLAKRPELVFEGRTWLANENHVRGEAFGRGSDWNGYGVWQVRLRDGDPASCLMKWSTYSNEMYRDTYTRIPSYDDHHKGLVTAEENRWNAVATDALYCDRMITEWKPAEVAEVAKKVPLVHAPNPRKTWAPACRFQVFGHANFNVSTDDSKVTCPKCRKYLETAAQRAT